jgi:hypothetical protein
MEHPQFAAPALAMQDRAIGLVDYRVNALCAQCGNGVAHVLALKRSHHPAQSMFFTVSHLGGEPKMKCLQREQRSLSSFVTAT